MKTLLFILVATIGMHTENFMIMIICLLIAIYLFYRIEFKKQPKKVERSESAFKSVANQKCECDNPCNKYCHNERISNK
jgi:H+/gluconate symporter-like permease